jgi:hypothetical protein
MGMILSSNACTADTLDINFKDHDMVRFFLIYEASAFSLNTPPKNSFSISPLLKVASEGSRNHRSCSQSHQTVALTNLTNPSLRP